MDSRGLERGPALAIVVAASLLTLGVRGSAAADQDLPFTLKQVGPGVFAAIDRDGKAGSDSGFVIGEDGVLVIDSFQHPEAAQALLAEIRKLTPLPVRWVVNTHYHLDHTAGNKVYADAGARVIAHRNERGWLRSENLKFFGPTPKPEQKAMVESLVQPELLVNSDLTIQLGARRIEVRSWLGHTGGDLVVVVPDARVMFCGDLLWRRTSPNLIDATVARWTETLDAWAHTPRAESYTFVPGHGDVATLDDVRDFRAYLQDVSDAVRKEMAAGLSGDALTKAVLADLQPKYGGWQWFDRMAPREIPLMAAELAGTKRVPKVEPPGS